MSEAGTPVPPSQVKTLPPTTVACQKRQSVALLLESPLVPRRAVCSTPTGCPGREARASDWNAAPLLKLLGPESFGLPVPSSNSHQATRPLVTVLNALMSVRCHGSSMPRLRKYRATWLPPVSDTTMISSPSWRKLVATEPVRLVNWLPRRKE